MKKLYVVIVVIVLFIANSCIERESKFIVFLEGKESEAEITLLVDKTTIYKGKVGYGSLGKRQVNINLRGGYHSLTIFFKGQRVKKHFVVFLGETFVVTIWDKGKVDLEGHFLDFMFA
jgi:hypothetical protein